MELLSSLFNFVITTSKKYAIDESHGIMHSMNVLNYAHNIYNSEVVKNSYIKDYERIIYISAILHDMCDKKYINEEEGMRHIEEFLNDKISIEEISTINKIISTMSYSKVKVYGFPDLGNHQLAYHIVRESDLLTAYDFDRCVIYKMRTSDADLDTSYTDAIKLFNERVFKHNIDNLFITEYSKVESVKLHNNALLRIDAWRILLQNNALNNCNIKIE